MGLSKSAVDRLGDRLRDGTATDADWTLLEELRAERQRQLSDTVAMLRVRLGLEVTSRVKTTNTLVEKLRRERMRLSQMDDIGGARIKVVGSRLDQDAVVEQLHSLWPNARVKDRRSTPVHGYRAVHVIPVIEGWPTEIQVRTRRQDAVANLLERLADSWGRELRYGGTPRDADKPFVDGDPEFTRNYVLEQLRSASDGIAEVEEARAWWARHPDPPARAAEVLQEWEAGVDDVLDIVRQMIELADE